MKKEKRIAIAKEMLDDIIGIEKKINSIVWESNEAPEPFCDLDRDEAVALITIYTNCRQLKTALDTYSCYFADNKSNK